MSLTESQKEDVPPKPAALDAAAAKAAADPNVGHVSGSSTDTAGDIAKAAAGSELDPATMAAPMSDKDSRAVLGVKMKEQAGEEKATPETPQAARERADATTAGLSENQTSQKYDQSLGESMSRLGEKLFGKPEGLPENMNVAAKMWDYLKNNNGNEQKREFVMTRITTLRNSFIEAIKKRLNSNEKEVKENRAKLNELKRELEETEDKGLLRMLSVVGQSYKMQNSQLATQDVTTGVAKTEVMDSEELLKFENFLGVMERVKQVNIEELVDIIIEDQPFVTMLATMRTTRDQKIFDDSFAEFGRDESADKTEKKNDVLMTKFYALEYTDSSESKAVQVLDVKNSRGDTQLPSLNAIIEGNGEMKNHQHFIDLARLIGGNERGKTDESVQKNKSINRLGLESSLWVEIVRYMDPLQKQYLAYAIKLEYGDDKVKDFIKASMSAGVLNTMDLEQIADVKGLEWVKGEKMKDEIKKVKEWREDNQKNAAAFAHQLENHYMQNSFLQRGMGGIFGMMASVVGGVTTLANVVFPMADAWNDSTNKTWGDKLKDGAKRVLSSGMFYMGIGELVLGRQLISPFTYNEFFHLSATEQNVMDRASLGMAFDAAIVNNSKLSSYMVANWDRYEEIALRNKNNKNPKQGKLKRGEQELYEGDLKMTKKEAISLGYNSVDEAEATIRGVFNSAHNLYNIQSKEKFKEHINKNVIPLYAQPGTEFWGKNGEDINNDAVSSADTSHPFSEMVRDLTGTGSASASAAGAPPQNIEQPK